MESGVRARTPSRRGERGLATRLASGEAAAYAELLRDHGPAMYAAAHRCLGDRASAEDALQDAFVSVFRHVAGFHGASRLSTWLHRVAVNAALMQRRSQARRPWTLLDGPALEAAAGEARLARSAAHPADLLARREAAARLHGCVGRLPHRCRGVVQIHDVDGRSLQETARLLGISSSAVKSRLEKGRRLVREDYASGRRAAGPDVPRCAPRVG